MKVIYWNIKGLQSPNKRSKVLRFLKRYHPNVVCLQKTHLPEGDFHSMMKLWEVYGSPATGGKASVLTLVNRNFPHSFVSHENDSEGRVSVVKVLCGGNELALCNIYGPNGDNAAFFLGSGG